MTKNLLEIDDLRTYFFTEAGVVKAVDGISLKVKESQTIGLVGESGSGKTVTALSALRVVPRPGRIVGGSIKFDGEDLLAKSDEEMRKYRGAKMAVVFQDPTTSLNPVYTVEKQLSDILMLHMDMTKHEASKSALRLLERVGIPEPEKRLKTYPHELSGGMKQRVAIARAFCVEGDLLILDEPFSSLDAQTRYVLQMEVLKICEKMKRTVIFITNNIEESVFLADRLIVLSSVPARIIKEISVKFSKPRNVTHPDFLQLRTSISNLSEIAQDAAGGLR